MPSSATSSSESPAYPAWASSVERTLDIGASTRVDSVRLALYRADGGPASSTHFAARVGEETITGATDEIGVAEFPLPGAAPARIGLAWDGPSPEGPFEYVRELRLGGEDEGTWVSNLSNLGYHCDGSTQEAVSRFQLDEGVDAEPFPTGDQPQLPEATKARLHEQAERLHPK